MSLPEMHVRAKADRIWILRLKSELGPEIFEHVISLMLKGNSVRDIAIYCHKVNSKYQPETYRKWLRILDRNTIMSQRREENLTQQATHAFNTAQAKTKSPSAPEEPEAPSEEGYRWLKRNVTKAYKNIDTENMLKFLWIMGQRRLDEVMEFEKRTGMPYPNAHKTFGELTKVAVAHMQFEHRLKTLKISDGNDIDVSQLDPVAQGFAQLSDVDRNIIHNLRRRFVKIMAEDPEYNGSALEGLEFTETGTTESKQIDKPVK
jgi:hypothetical protein